MSHSPLTSTMTDALDAMKKHGGLKRLPGGFWIRPSAPTFAGESWFGTTTMEALVKRGVAKYTEWTGDPRFPIRVEAVK